MRAKVNASVLSVIISNDIRTNTSRNISFTNFKGQEQRNKYREKVDKLKQMDPVNAQLNGNMLGCVSEKMHEIITSLRQHPHVKSSNLPEVATKKNQLSLERFFVI